MKLKKLLTFIISVSLLIPSVSSGSEDLNEGTCMKRNFLVSAYYSPLANQKMYIRGSLEKDIILNGRGTNGADGTEVYMGLLAAPRGYNFGSKIILPGLGVGTVHDRGGAIVAKSGYDRIDVWMGKGEEGLSRALNWGMRFIEGEKCSKEVNLKDTLNYFTISSKLPSSVEERLIAKSKGNYVQYVKEEAINAKKSVQLFKYLNFTSKLQMGSTGPNVTRLQMILQNIGFYNHNVITGIYDINTMEAIFQFQRENGIILGDKSVGAGYFGEKTSKALDEYLGGLHSTIKDVGYSKQGDLIGDPDYSFKASIMDIDITPINISSLPLKMADLMILDETKTVSEIQEILRNKGDNSNTSVVAGSDVENIQ